MLLIFLLTCGLCLDCELGHMQRKPDLHIAIYRSYIYVWIYVSVAEIREGNMLMQSVHVNTICKGDYMIKGVFPRRIND